MNARTKSDGPALRPVAAPTRIVVAGGGYVGLYAALRLRSRLGARIRRGEVAVTVVDPRSFMTYQPFLPEAAAGSLEPRHVVVPLRKELEGVDVVTGRIAGINHLRQSVQVEPVVGETYDLPYDHLVVALGSVSRVLAIPGLAEHGIGFKQVEEAVALRNHVLDRLDVAASTGDEDVRRRALTFVVVGGGYAGVEALAEMEDMARYATRYVDGIDGDDMRWVLVEASDRILPEVGPDLGEYTRQQLEERGIEVRMRTRLVSVEDGVAVLSDDEELSTDTLVWTAGVRANPVLASSDLPLDAQGRVLAQADLRVAGADGVLDGVWAAGDNAAVPDLTADDPDAVCSPSAQHAVRQATRLADNLVAVLDGRETTEYRHKHVGSVASLGLYRGVAEVYGVKLRGFPAWFMHRTYHMSRMPTLNRKVRVVTDWTLALLFRREVVSLGTMHAPREEFARAVSLTEAA